MLLNDEGTLLTTVQFQMSLYDGCHSVYIVYLGYKMHFHIFSWIFKSVAGY